MNYIGMKVSHDKYGVGIIVLQRKDKITIKFTDHGEKDFIFPGSVLWLPTSYNIK